MLVDGDTFYEVDIVKMFGKVTTSKRSGASFVFKDTQKDPIYSYVTIPKESHGDMAIETIKEKVKISDWANTGCYCFHDGQVLLEYCRQIVEKGETQLSQDQKGEFYTSGVIKAMLDDGYPFEAIVLKKSDMHVLGTPSQVVEFCNGFESPPAQRFCFDIDNTLFTSPRTPGDYTTCVPIERTVRLLRSLHAQGHYIILSTARRMRTHGANIGGVVADVGLVTLLAIRDAGIPHHEIHFGKPWAQFYVDDKGINAFTDLEKELGFYKNKKPAVASKFTTPAKSGSFAGASLGKFGSTDKHHSWPLLLAVSTYAAVLTLLVLKGGGKLRSR